MRKPDGWEKQKLLSDKDVAIWFEGNLLRSKVSAETDLRKLGLLAHRLGTTPAGIVKLARSAPDELARKLVHYATELRKQGRLDSYVLKTFSGLKSWLRSRRINFDLYPKLPSIQGLSLRSETVPTQEQLGRILAALTLRGRAVALLMAHSGLRPGTISKEGTAGLRLRDLEDLELTGAEPAFRKQPFLIRVPATLSKTGREYVTFGTSEESSALHAYLARRQNDGEKLGPESPVVAVAPHQAENWRRRSQRTNGFVTTETITFELRTGIRKVTPPGTRWRPYVLRAYCSSHLVSAESAAKITRDVREAILGHDLGVSGRYNLSKKLHPDQVEEMRAAYQRCEPYLSTTPVKESNDGATRVIRALLVARGYSSAEADRLDIGGMTDSELESLFKKLGAQSSDAEGHRVERAIALAEVPGHLERGWEFVARLDDERAILRSPDGRIPPGLGENLEQDHLESKTPRFQGGPNLRALGSLVLRDSS